MPGTLNPKVRKIEEGYEVQSFTEESKYYFIRKAVFGKHWICSCPAFTRRTENIPCKHIQFLGGFLEGVKDA